jgi:hypothetical protein
MRVCKTIVSLFLMPLLALANMEAQEGLSGDPVLSISPEGSSDVTPVMCEPVDDCCCPNGRDKSAKTLIILIHGVNPTGNEFNRTKAILGSSHCVEIKEFKYDDDECSDKITEKLKAFVAESRGKDDKYCKVILFGHSAGGIMAGKLAADPEAAPLEVHTAATPTQGGGHGWPAWIARPFIGCLKAEIGAGPGPFKAVAQGSSVTHHKTTDEDDGVLGAGYQSGNEVPGSSSQTHPDVCHSCILGHVAQKLKPDCPEPQTENCQNRSQQ